MTEHLCEREGCTSKADGVLAFRLFPFAALMRHYRTDKHLTQLVLGLDVCRRHCAEIDPVTFLGAQVWPIVRAVESQTGIAVDMAATKAVLLAFDDPDVLRLQRMREQQKGGAS